MGTVVVKFSLKRGTANRKITKLTCKFRVNLSTNPMIITITDTKQSDLTSRQMRSELSSLQNVPTSAVEIV